MPAAAPGRSNAELRALLPDAVASAVAKLYLDHSLPLQRLHTAAVSVFQLQWAYWQLTGEGVHERTLHNWRRELLGEPVGQLPDQPETVGAWEVKRRGANTYDLPSYSELWPLVLAALHHALSIRRQRKKQRWQGAHGVNSHIRTEGALRWAVSSIDRGRNNVGYRLVLLLRGIGCEPDEVESVLRDFQESVCHARPGDPYTWSEARASLRSGMRVSV